MLYPIKMHTDFSCRRGEKRELLHLPDWFMTHQTANVICETVVAQIAPPTQSF